MEANLKYQLWPLERVKPYERNVKRHDDEQIDRIVQSILTTGFDQPIVVDKDGVIIKGHGRRIACIKIGLKQVPVIVRDDLTPEQVRAARLADNRVALSGIDTEMLRVELSDLNLELLKDIFDQKELDYSMADLGSINTDPLIEDLNAAVMLQEEGARAAADASAARRVPLTKAFGFKDIAGADEIYVTRFLARVETDTGLTGADALIAFLKKLVA